MRYRLLLAVDWSSLHEYEELNGTRETKINSDKIDQMVKGVKQRV
jgi:hypothetical protein